jgi:hypothetical protein
MFAALRIALPFLLFSIESEPAEKVLLGFAVRAVKSAPEPTAVATAATPSASVASVRLRPFLSSPAGRGRIAAPSMPSRRRRNLVVPPTATSWSSVSVRQPS